MKKILIILIFCFVISVPVVVPFLHRGYFPTHDGEWAIVRLGDMFRTLRDFQIPARYSGNLNFGYGYPLFNFTYPLPYYLGTVIYMLGGGFVDSIKILFVGSVFLSAFFMFLASRILWKNTWAGIASSILYVYFPYRMVDLYVRGSLGESLSFVLFPLLFYLAIKSILKPSFLLIGGASVTVAALIMTHNIMTVLFLPVYLSFVSIQIITKNIKTLKPFFISIFLGFGLSAFFWVPALFEKNNILLSQIPIADRNLHFVTLRQLIFPSWGYGVPTNLNGFSYQLGLANIVIFIIVIMSLIFLFIKNRKCLNDYFVRMGWILSVITVFYVFLLFKPSEFLWENIPLLSEINYPWIILGILSFLISLLTGFLCRYVVGKHIAIILGIVAIVMVLPYVKPQKYINKGDSYYLTNDATTTSSNELMPLWVKKIPIQRLKEKVEIINGKGILEAVSSNSKQVKFSINALSQSTIRINTIYYPGWNALIDDINMPISYSNEKGVMDISVSLGKHIIQVNFKETQLRLISDIISISSLFTLLFIILRKNKYEYS